MAAPTYVDRTTLSTGNGSGTMALSAPSGTQADDILLLVIATASNNVLSSANLTAIASAGFSELSGSPRASGGTSSTEFYGFWARATSSSPTMPSWTNTTLDYVCAMVHGIRGCATSGNPWDVFQFNSDTDNDTSGNYFGITTTVNDTHVLYAAATRGASGASGMEGTNLSAFNPRGQERFNSFGQDGGIHAASGDMATAGATGTATCFTNFSSDSWLVIAFAGPSGPVVTTATPDTAALAISTFAPTVLVTNNVVATPGTASLVITAYAPTAALAEVDVPASTDDGFVQVVDAVYPPLATATANTTGVLNVGQQYTGEAPSPYWTWQSFISFDTTGFSAADVEEAVLYLTGHFDLSDTAEFRIEVSVFDWGSSVTPADYRSPTELAALTRVAYWDSVEGVVGGTTYAFHDIALLANINFGGTTRFVLSSSRNRAQVSPVGNEYVAFRSANYVDVLRAPATSKPVLHLKGKKVNIAQPPALHMALATLAPSIAVTDNKVATVPTASLSLTTFAPTIALPVSAVPPTRSLTLTTFPPIVGVSANRTAVVPTASLLLASFAPTVSATANLFAVPATVHLLLSSLAPIVTRTGHVTANPPTAALHITLYPPVVTYTASVVAVPGTAVLHLTTYAPVVSVAELPDVGEGVFRIQSIETEVLGFRIEAEDPAGLTVTDDALTLVEVQ